MQNKYIFLGMFFFLAFATLIYASPTQRATFIVNSTASTNNVSFNETYFNDSTTIKNFTFTQGSSNTTYIQVHKSIGVVNATLNITGLESNWTYKTIPFNCTEPDMVMDHNDNLQICCLNYSDQFLVHGLYNKTSKTWTTTEIFDTNQTWGAYCAIDVDSTNNAKIVFNVITPEGELQFPYYNVWFSNYSGSSWSTQELHHVRTDTIDYYGNVFDIKIDSSNNYHISYTDCDYAALWYAKWDGASWSNETVNYGGSGCYFNAIDVNSTGYPRIAYQNQNDDKAYYATKSATWVNEKVWDFTMSRHIDLVINSSDNPHILLRNNSLSGIHVYKTGGSWTNETVENTQCTDPVIRLDSTGKLVAGCGNATTEVLRLATKDGSWSVNTIYNIEFDAFGSLMMMDLDSSNQPWFIWASGPGYIISQWYPESTVLTLNGTHVWNNSGVFNNTQTAIFKTQLESYLANCVPDSYGRCNVPLTFNSSEIGIQQASAINITYNYNTTFLFTENSNSGNYFWNQTTGILAGANYKKHFKVTNTSNTSANNITVSGYYLKNQTATACYVNETAYTPTGTPKYCPITFSINTGENWKNHNISDKPLTIAVTVSESSYSQDATKQTEAGASNYSYIYSILNLTNPTDTGEALTGTFSQSARSGWTCDSGCTGIFSLSDGSSNSSYITNQSKLNAITKTEVVSVMDTTFQSELVANSSINLVDYYYWNTTLEINNTDSSINYTNVRWHNYLQGADFSYAENISNGTLTQTNFSSPINVTSRFRTTSVKTTEIVTDTGTSYEKDITVTCPSDTVDSAFVTNNYYNVLVNVTISTSYTVYDFYWWNGVAWEKHTETSYYNFTPSGDLTFASFKTNCSTHYYAISSETPEYQPPAETPTGGAGPGPEPIVKIISGNWSILQPNFYLLAAPGSEVVSYITIDNKMNNDIEYVNLTCIPSTCKPNDPCSCVDLCPYVTFGEKLVQVQGKPFFQVYQIPPGQSGKAPFFVNFTSAYAYDHNLSEIQQCFYSFSINVEIDQESHPVNVQVIALPGMEEIGKGLSWLQRKTLLIPGKYPVYIDNWLLLIIAIIVMILMFVGIINY